MMTLAQNGDRENAQWRMERVQDRNEDLEVRKSALFFMGTESDAVNVQQIASLYSPTLDFEMRKQVLFVLSQRREAAAVDKLLEIAKNDPDRELRKQAVFWLGQSGSAEDVAFLQDLYGKVQGDRIKDKIIFSTEGSAYLEKQNFPAEAEYAFRVRAWANKVGDGPARMTLRVDGKDVKTFDVTAPEDKPGVYEVTAKIPRGENKRVAVVFANPFEDAGAKQFRNLGVERLEIEGPLGKVEPPLSPEDQDRITRLLVILTSSTALRTWRDHLGSSVDDVADDIEWFLNAAIAAAHRTADR